MRGARDQIERGVRLLCASFGGDAHRERGDDSRTQAQSIRLMCVCALKVRVESKIQITGQSRATKAQLPRPPKTRSNQVNTLVNSSVFPIYTIVSQLTYLVEEMIQHF